MILKSKINQLVSHQGFMRYLKNTSWLMGERVLRMGVGLFVGIWVARYLGPAQFGLLSYAQSFVFLFTAIATLGLDAIVVRELVKHPEKRGSLLGTAFGLKLIGAIMILPVLAIAVQLTSNDSYTNLLVFIIASATIFQSFNVIDFYCQATVQSKYVALANTVTLAISSVIKIGLILNEASLIAFAAMVVFDSAVLSFGLIYFYLKRLKLKNLYFKFSRTMAIELLKDSWPLILSGLVISVYMKIDQVMIKEMIDVTAVGQYAAAVRLSEAWYFIPMAITSSLFPAIVSAKKESKTLYLQRLQRMYTLMVWLAIAIALPMSFLSNWVVTYLYGDVYQQAGQVLMIHVWASIFVFLGAAGAFFTIEGLTNLFLYKCILGAIANIVLNLFLMKYGLIYVAVSTLVAQFLASYLLDLFFKEARCQFYLKSYAFLGRW